MPASSILNTTPHLIGPNTFVSWRQKYVYKLSLVPLLLFVIAFPLAQAGDDDPEKSTAVVVSKGTDAVPVEREPPDYPVKALKDRIEGWVVVSMVVNPEGGTEDITILETSIDRYFEKAAIKAVEKWTYEPATRNGVPVTQAKNTARLTFKILDSWGVSKFFHKRYKKAQKAVQDGDLETAKQIIDQLDKREQKRLAEVSFLDLLKAQYWQKSGDLVAALKHHKRALVFADEVFQPGTHIQLLRAAILLSIQQQEYASVLARHEKLLEVAGKTEPDDPINKYVMQVRQFLQSDSPYPSNGTITQPCPSCETLVPFWRHVLVRNQFSIQEVDGEVSELKLFCGLQYISLAYVAETVWTVNKEWGDCDLHVLGTDGTTFTLIEH